MEYGASPTGRGSPGPSLPPGYNLDESDPEILHLRRPGVWPIATFSAAGTTRENIEKAAREDHHARRGIRR